MNSSRGVQLKVQTLCTPSHFLKHIFNSSLGSFWTPGLMFDTPPLRHKSSEGETGSGTWSPVQVRFLIGGSDQMKPAHSSSLIAQQLKRTKNLFHKCVFLPAYVPLTPNLILKGARGPVRRECGPCLIALVTAASGR